MAKKKQARKYVTVSLSRDFIHDIDQFLKLSGYAKIYTSRADFIHRAIDKMLEDYEDREERLETRKLKDWYFRNLDKLQKRGIESWNDLLIRAMDYSERLDKK